MTKKDRIEYKCLIKSLKKHNAEMEKKFSIIRKLLKETSVTTGKSIDYYFGKVLNQIGSAISIDEVIKKLEITGNIHDKESEV